MLKGIKDMMQMAQQMQGRMQEMQAELEHKEVCGYAGGDMVAVTMNGRHRVTKVVINPEAVDPDDIELLQDLVHAAVNDAVHRVESMVKEEMQAITGGMNIPGITGMM
jgi:nucleoid-associated protein EbfC